MPESAQKSGSTTPSKTPVNPAGESGAKGQEEKEFGKLKQQGFNAEPLTNKLNKTIKIAKVEYPENTRFEAVILIDTEGNRYYTFSQVIIRQVRDIVEPELQQGNIVVAKVIRETGERGKYLTLA
jgi:hypothetical protein